jgi:hypothetical protein
MSTASVDVFSGWRALVASAVDPRAIQGPGLLLKQGFIGRSGSSRGQGSRCKRNGECDRTMGGWRRCDGVSSCAVRRAKGQHGGERVRAWAMHRIGCEACFRAHSASHPYSRHHCILAVVSGFLPCFSQVSFELLDRLVEGSIIAETLRSE